MPTQNKIPDYLADIRAEADEVAFYTCPLCGHACEVALFPRPTKFCTECDFEEALDD